VSLILEALKKSEAERRVGQPPGLLSHAPFAPPQRRSPWPWLLLVLVPILVLAAWWFGRTSAPPVETPVAQAPAEPAPAPAEAESAPYEPAPAAAPPRPAAVATPRPALREAPPPAPEDARTERESQPMLPTEGEIALQLPAPLPAPVYSEVTAAAPVSSPAAEPDLPELRELPSALRADLPPLRVSMHVFDADPARRFVLIDGRRLTEGGRIDTGLDLVEIRRDGSVLAFRGQRFLLPRP